MPAPLRSNSGRVAYAMRTAAAVAGLALLAVVLLVVTATAGAGGAAKHVPQPQGKVYTWYEGSRPESAWLAAVTVTVCTEAIDAGAVYNPPP